MSTWFVAVAVWLCALVGVAHAQSGCSTDAQCADGNPCNGAERCLAGVCQPGSPLVCNDGDACTLDFCQAPSGCRHAPLADDTTCDNGNECDGTDTCQAGRCTPGTPLPEGSACSTGNPCTSGDFCQAGLCRVGIARADGAACDDANACNGREVCQAGICVGGTPPGNGAPCGDGNPCNGTDTCVNQICVAGPPLPNGASCNDGNPCNGSEVCQNNLCTGGTPRPNGTPCPDGNACNGNELCHAGICQPGTAVDCDDHDPCTVDQCDASGVCTHTGLPDGTVCSDGNPCNGFEVCRDQRCRPGAPVPNGTACSTGNPCTNGDFCQSGTCRAGVVRPDGSGCGDGNECNGREACQAGVCTPGAPKPNGAACGDGNPCNGDDTCQDQVCVVGAPAPNGTPCSDGNVCNGTEACEGGVCTGAPAPAPNDTPCPDDNLCNGAEVCRNGTCQSGTPLDCDDHNRCTNDSCGKSVGCKHVERPVDVSCDDGDPCNGRETCQAGAVCTPGTPPADGANCGDGNVCNGFEECRGGRCTTVITVPDGFGCPDDSICNGLETCHGGFCTAGTPLTCSDGNPCSADVCDPSDGCRFPTLPDGTLCDNDQNVCDGGAVCQSGSCQQTPPLDCDDGNPNTPDVCDPAVGCTEDAPIAGDRLKVSLTSGGRTSVLVRTREQIDLNVPPSASSARDPVLHGGVLRIRSATTGFDRRFSLPRQLWSRLGSKVGSSKGFRYRDRARGAPVRSVVVKNGKVAKVVGSSSQLGPGLTANPQPVEIVLILGNTRYCMAFGGEIRFDEGDRFLASGAAAPDACPL